MTADPTPRTGGLAVLAVGLTCGFAGDALLRTLPWGLSVPLATLVFLGGGWALIRMRARVVDATAPWVALAALLAATAFVAVDSPSLRALDFLTLGFAVAVAARAVRGAPIREWGVTTYALAMIEATGNAFLGWIEVFRHVTLPSPSRGAAGGGTRFRPVAAGVLLALPLLLVFGGLFVAADAQFEAFAGRVFSIDLAPLVRHLFFIGFWGALATGTLCGALLRQTDWTSGGLSVPEGRVPFLTGATTLALLNTLLVVFVALQLRWLFGGSTVVEQTTGLTVAQYARRGFFELVTAAALALPVLLAADWLTRRDTPAERQSLHALIALTIMLVIGLLVSALQRMVLYVSAFGLTEQRFYTTAFMLWLAFVLIWFSLTVLRGGHHRFAFGSAVAAAVLSAGLHLASPDAIIVRANVARLGGGRPPLFDADYLGSRLSADAVPALWQAFPQLPAAARARIATHLLRRWGATPPPDWRSWNWSVARARGLVRQHWSELESVAGVLH